MHVELIQAAILISDSGQTEQKVKHVPCTENMTAQDRLRLTLTVCMEWFQADITMAVASDDQRHGASRAQPKKK